MTIFGPDLSTLLLIALIDTLKMKQGIELLDAYAINNIVSFLADLIDIESFSQEHLPVQKW